MKIVRITPADKAFPEALKQISSPPKQLYIWGDSGVLSESPKLAVIGSRKVTPYGRGATQQLSQTAAGQGVVIISGLALGVDAIAHQAALDAGGKTIAILAGGVDNPTPMTNRQLAQRIVERGGAIISEYPEGTPPMRQNFIERNRLVSGLSDGVLITEAADKSGTLHTASFALDQGKTVMCVPGNITSELSKGTNNLIKTGAVPVTEPNDIMRALGLGEQLRMKEVLAANKEEEAILSLLKQGMTDSSELQAISGLAAATFNRTLTMLEITGKVRPTGAGHWTIC